MCEYGCFPAKWSVKHYMKRQRWEPLFTANNMADLHKVVINDIGQVICRHSVRLEKYLVVKCACIHNNMPSYHIVKMNIFIQGHFESYDIRCPIFKALLPISLRQRKGILKAISCRCIVDEGLPLFFSILPQYIELIGWIKGIIGIIFINQKICILPENILFVALTVGTIFSAFIYPFIHGYSAPLQGFHYIFLCTLNKPGLVSIFDP